MGACTKQGQLKIITELMHTDCEKLLKSSRPLTLFRKLKMLKDAALGMNWLHGILHIIHHDLKVCYNCSDFYAYFYFILFYFNFILLSCFHSVQFYLACKFIG